MWARIQDGLAAEVTFENPEGRFHPSLQWAEVPPELAPWLPGVSAWDLTASSRKTRRPSKRPSRPASRTAGGLRPTVGSSSTGTASRRTARPAETSPRRPSSESFTKPPSGGFNDMFGAVAPGNGGNPTPTIPISAPVAGGGGAGVSQRYSGYGGAGLVVINLYRLP